MKDGIFFYLISFVFLNKLKDNIPKYQGVLYLFLDSSKTFIYKKTAPATATPKTTKPVINTGVKQLQSSAILILIQDVFDAITDLQEKMEIPQNYLPNKS